MIFENGMNIKNFSILTNISAHTLRYYEKIGLLKQIERNSSGHRYFTQKDVVWVEFIKRLKETGMPLKQILTYADLRDVGISTSGLRMKILEEHALILEEKIAEEQSHLKMLRTKIQYYSKIIE